LTFLDILDLCRVVFFESLEKAITYELFMFVLGLQGSPRIKGNTSILLSEFLAEAGSLGAYTKRLDVARMSITPCQECGICEKEGFCPIDDDMQQIFLWGYSPDKGPY
jgi:hypothetical protein